MQALLGAVPACTRAPLCHSRAKRHWPQGFMRSVSTCSMLTITVVISSLILLVDNLGNCCAVSVVGYILADFLKILRIHDRFLSFQEEAPLLMY